MNKQIGEAISAARQNQKLTQEELAMRLGVTPQAVSKWERGVPVVKDTALNITTPRLYNIKSTPTDW